MPERLSERISEPMKSAEKKAQVTPEPVRIPAAASFGEFSSVYSRLGVAPAGNGAPEPPPATMASILEKPEYTAPANAPRKAEMVTDLQQRYGNAFLQQVMAQTQQPGFDSFATKEASAAAKVKKDTPSPTTETAEPTPSPVVPPVVEDRLLAEGRPFDTTLLKDASARMLPEPVIAGEPPPEKVIPPAVAPDLGAVETVEDVVAPTTLADETAAGPAAATLPPRAEPSPTREDAATLDSDTGDAADKELAAAPQDSIAAPSTVSPDRGRAEAPAAEAAARRRAKAPEGAAPPSEESVPLGVKGPAGAEAAADEAAEAKKEGVAAFLLRTTQAVFKRKQRRVRRLAKHQKQKEDSGTKVARAQKAVVPPIQEGMSRARATQVAAIAKVPPPKVDETKARQKLNQALTKALPRTIEDVDEFQDRAKGRIVGEAVKAVVVADTQTVDTAYRQIEQTPPPQPPAKDTPLPPIETAPETPPLAMGRGIVGQVQPEHTDLSRFENESDALLAKEGISEELLDQVDEGDLAEAKRERQTIKTKVKEEPKAVQAFQQQEKQKVRTTLRKEEATGRRRMASGRRKALQGARSDQKRTKSKIEQQREAVTAHINGIYAQANKTVKQKLADLEKKSLAEFDRGQAQAARTFESNVKRRINAFKARRYAGGGVRAAYRRVRDWALGIDDMPEVKTIFDTEKSAFELTVNALVKKITDDNRRVIEECKKIITDAKAEIKKYVDGLKPALRKTGQKALTTIKTKLDALDRDVNRKERDLQKKLAAKRDEAIKAIEKKIEKMKEEMSGALSKLGNFLLNAMLKFFKWALKKAGYDAQQTMDIINKGKIVLQKIVRDPKGFFRNLGGAVSLGLNNFKKNIKQHLLTGLFTWLTGAMAGVPIQLPKTWDLKGILFLILQVLGLTWDRLRAKLVKRVGEPTVAAAEKAVDIIQRVRKEGPIALWHMLKEKAAELKQKAIEGVRNWVITQIVKTAIKKLVLMLNPVGAIIQAIIAIYKVVTFFIENWDRIVTFVKTLFGAIVPIAMGKVGAAAKLVETALAQTIPIILSFLAKFLNLGGIGKAITGIIKKIRAPVDKIVDKALDGAVKLARKFIGKGKAAVAKGKEVTGTVVAWFKMRRSFKTTKGESHKLFFKKRGKRVSLRVASAEEDYDQFLNRARQILGQQRPRKSAMKELIQKADRLSRSLNNEITKKKVNENEVRAKLDEIGKVTRELIDLLAEKDIPDGSRGKPYIIKWHKTFSHNYPVIKLMLKPGASVVDVSPLSRTRIEVHEAEGDVKEELTKLKIQRGYWKGQLTLEQRREKPRKTKIKEYQKEKSEREFKIEQLEASVGLKEYRIGITPRFQVFDGKLIGPSKKGRKDKEKEKFKKVLKKAGFNWGGYDAEHVTDQSLGGKDDFKNLWPLDVNPSPYQKIDKYTGKQTVDQVPEWKPQAGKKDPKPKLPWEMPPKYYRVSGIKKPTG